MKTIQSRSPDFFLGATTPAGFKGYFEPLRREPGMQMLLIKSGPGCGKSTLMKHLAQAAEQQGQRIEKIHCASDPDSLDGVIFLDQKRAIIDATGNQVLLRLWEQCNMRNWFTISALTDAKSLKKLQVGHQKLTEAICRRNLKGATATLEDHLTSLMDGFIRGVNP